MKMNIKILEEFVNFVNSNWYGKEAVYIYDLGNEYIVYDSIDEELKTVGSFPELDRTILYNAIAEGKAIIMRMPDGQILVHKRPDDRTTEEREEERNIEFSRKR